MKYKLHPIPVLKQTRDDAGRIYGLKTINDYRLCGGIHFALPYVGEGGYMKVKIEWLREFSGNHSFTIDDLLALPYVSDDEYLPGDGMRGRATEFRLSTELGLTEEYLNRHDYDGKVDFLTGKEWTSHRRKQYEKEISLELAATTAEYANHPTASLIEYMHSLRYRKAIRRKLRERADHVDRAIDALSDILRQDKKTGEIIQDPIRRQVARDTIVKMECTYMKFRPARRTDRVFAAGNSLQTLCKDVRHALFAGCTEIDLKSSQLRLIRYLWDVPSLDRVMGDWWGYLRTETGEQEKAFLKPLTYGLSYGMSKRNDFIAEVLSVNEKENLKVKITPERAEALVEKFLALPEVRDIVRARNAEGRKIVAEGGIMDAWGVWHSIKDLRDDDGNPMREDEAKRSLRARKIQSYELRIMLAGFGEIEKDQDIQMLLWLHDGMVLEAVSHKDRLRKKIDRVIEAMKKEAGLLGVSVLPEVKAL